MAASRAAAMVICASNLRFTARSRSAAVASSKCFDSLAAFMPDAMASASRSSILLP